MIFNLNLKNHLSYDVPTAEHFVLCYVIVLLFSSIHALLNAHAWTLVCIIQISYVVHVQTLVGHFVLVNLNLLVQMVNLGCWWSIFDL